MLLLAPAAFAGIVYLVFLERSRAKGAIAPWRESLLATAIAAGVLVALITEALSLFEAVTRGAVFASWCAAAVGLAVWQRRAVARFRRPAAVRLKLTKTGWLAASLGLTAIAHWLGQGWLGGLAVANIYLGLGLGLVAEARYLADWYRGVYD